MLLNPLDQNFVIALDYNWFYPDISMKWLPIMHRLYLPYITCEDFFNANITSINFPGISSPSVEQQGKLYKITKRPGNQVDQIIDKTISLTVKTTESYISYFMARHQFDLFLRLGLSTPVYLPDISVTLLDDGGFETITYRYQQLTPISLGDLSMSYAARMGQFNTFTWTFKYNYYDVYMRGEDGDRVLISKQYDPNIDGIIEYLDLDNDKYSQKQHPGISSKQKVQELHSMSKHPYDSVIGTYIPRK